MTLGEDVVPFSGCSQVLWLPHLRGNPSPEFQAGPPREWLAFLSSHLAMAVSSLGSSAWASGFYLQPLLPAEKDR